MLVNALLMSPATVVIPATAASAITATTSAYSIKSWPSFARRTCVRRITSAESFAFELFLFRIIFVQTKHANPAVDWAHLPAGRRPFPEQNIAAGTGHLSRFDDRQPYRSPRTKVCVNPLAVLRELPPMLVKALLISPATVVIPAQRQAQSPPPRGRIRSSLGHCLRERAGLSRKVSSENLSFGWFSSVSRVGRVAHEWQLTAHLSMYSSENVLHRRGRSSVNISLQIWRRRCGGVYTATGICVALFFVIRDDGSIYPRARTIAPLLVEFPGRFSRSGLRRASTAALPISGWQHHGIRRAVSLRVHLGPEGTGRAPLAGQAESMSYRSLGSLLVQPATARPGPFGPPKGMKLDVVQSSDAIQVVRAGRGLRNGG